MSPRKLGRFYGLVFVLVVVLGGQGVTSVDDGVTTTGDDAMVQMNTLSVEWD